MNEISELEILARGVDLYSGLTSRFLVWGAIAGEFTYEEAIAAAAKIGRVLPTPAEAILLWHLSEEFRLSVKNTYFWLDSSSSVNSVTRDTAWVFYGYYGYVDSLSRITPLGVRCVGRPCADLNLSILRR